MSFDTLSVFSSNLLSLTGPLRPLIFWRSKFQLHRSISLWGNWWNWKSARNAKNVRIMQIFYICEDQVHQVDHTGHQSCLILQWLVHICCRFISLDNWISLPPFEKITCVNGGWSQTEWAASNLRYALPCPAVPRHLGHCCPVLPSIAQHCLVLPSTQASGTRIFTTKTTSCDVKRGRFMFWNWRKT